jgi:hypothetical protein
VVFGIVVPIAMRVMPGLQVTGLVISTVRIKYKKEGATEMDK